MVRPPLAALTTIAAASIGSGLGNTYSMVLGDFSPTHTYALLLSLGICIYVTQFLKTKMTPWSLLLLAFLSFSLMGSRITQALLVFSGVSLLVIWSYFYNRSVLKRALWIWAGMVPGLLIAFKIVISGGTANGLAFAPNAEVASLWGLVPISGAPGLVLGALSLIASVLVACLGLVWFLKSNPRKWEPSVSLVLGILISGVLACLLTAQPGRAQVSFIWAAVAIAGTLSATGAAFSMRAFLANSSGNKRATATALSLSLTLVVAWFCWMAPRAISDHSYPAVLRFAIPFILLGAIGLIALLTGRYIGVNSRKSLNLFIFLAVFAAVGTGFMSIPSKIAASGTAATRETPLALDSGYFEAASALRKLNDRGELVATNRFCGDVADSVPVCSSIVFNVSALTGLPTLLEGYDYSVGFSPGSGVPLAPWALTRVEAATGFADSPSQDNAQELWDFGVRWFWVDNAVTPSRNWSPYADEVFTNSEVTLLRMRNPSELGHVLTLAG